MTKILKKVRKAIRTRLFPFQKKGVLFLEEIRGRGLICDSMGLGKTIQSIAWLAIHPKARPAIILCPSTIKYNWAREFLQHAKLKSYVCEGRKPKRKKLRKNDILILNYDILPYWLPELLQVNAQALIIDECQYVKNQSAKRTKAARELAKRSAHVIGLSGTPISGRPAEFFSILNMVRPDLFSSFWRYAFEYCDPKRNRWSGSWDFSGASNLQGLRKKLKGIMIRRMKNEVLHELPRKTRTIIPVEIDNRQEYERAQQEFLTWLKEEKGKEASERAKKAEAVVRLGALKMLAARGKINMAIRWIKDFLKASDSKLIVFAIHKEILSTLRHEFPDSALVRGSVSAQKKQVEVDRFQNDPHCRIFLGQIKAAGIGVTLTAASHVLFLEVGWTPTEHDQAEDRALRIGQKEHVNAYYFVGLNTVEEKVLATIQEKDGVCSIVLDGKKIGKMRLLDALLKELEDEC